MKKALLVAASLFTTATAVTTGEAVKASPQFTLTQSTAGNLIFQGVGTAQYNNSIGTNNSFQVGSSTNLGVNASTSSTPEYAVNSHAKLDLAGNSTLKQIIGTSGSSSNQAAEQTAAMTYAHDQASSTADKNAQSSAHTSASSTATSSADTSRSSWESNHGNTWANYESENQVDVIDTDGVTVIGTELDSSGYQNESEWSDASDSAWQSSYDSAYATAYTSDYSSAYENEYQTEYSSVYTDAISNIQSTSTAESTAGVIKGTFTTQEYGAAESGGSMSDWQETAEQSATESVESTYLNSWGDYVTYNTVDQDVYGTVTQSQEVDVYDTDGVTVIDTTTEEVEVQVVTGTESVLSSQAAFQNEQAYDDARAESYSTAYNSAYSDAMTSSSRTSSSDVEVHGIGSDASVTSAATSTFDVAIITTLSTPGDAESTATANGAAGANLSTSSFANQSQASTASAFMQAFGAAE